MLHTDQIWKTNKQYGFLPGRCTMDAIFQVMDDWEAAMDKKETVHAVFFDFAKAFDLVDHGILLKKMEKYLPEWITSWTAAYLTSQRVKCNGSLSVWELVLAGVIQGSVLGPILFLLFIIDINEELPENAKFFKYADDLLSYIVFKKAREDNTQQVIERIESWAKNNKMRLNVNKTKHMYINNINNISSSVILEDTLLEEVKVYEWIGVQANSEMNNDLQWEIVLKRTNPHKYLIKQLKRMGFKQELLMNIYTSLTLSQYLYSAPLLISASNSAKLEMDKQQQRFFNVIGIDSMYAWQVYKIPHIEEFIVNQCKLNVERMLKDPNHPLTINTAKKGVQSTRSSSFIPAPFNTDRYRDSVVQKSIRSKRDNDVLSKYTKPTRKEDRTTENVIYIQDAKRKPTRQQQIKKYNENLLAVESNVPATHPLPSKTLNTISVKPKMRCPHCSKEIIDVKGHIKRMHKDI